MPKEAAVQKLMADQDAYFHALGRFVDIFARIESHVFVYVSMLAGLNYDQMAILLGRETLERLCALCIEFATLRKWNRTSMRNLKIGLKQLDCIRLLRNTVLHNGTQISNFRPISTTDRLTKPPHKGTTEHVVSAKDYWRLCQDLENIREHLGYAFANTPAMRKQYRQGMLARRLRRGWLYDFDTKKIVHPPADPPLDYTPASRKRGRAQRSARPQG